MLDCNGSNGSSSLGFRPAHSCGYSLSRDAIVKDSTVSAVAALSRNAPLTSKDIRGDQVDWSGTPFGHEATRKNVRFALGRRNRLSKVATGAMLNKPLHAKHVTPMDFEGLCKRMKPALSRRIANLMFKLKNAYRDDAVVDKKFRAPKADVDKLRDAEILEEFTGSSYTSVRYFTVRERADSRRRPIMWPYLMLLASDYSSEFSLDNVSQYCRSVFAGDYAVAYDLTASFWQVLIDGCNFVLQDEDGKLWRITRMPFGVDCASEIMQIIVEELGRVATERAGLDPSAVKLFTHHARIIITHHAPPRHRHHMRR